jgi:hypothetical protein
VSAPVWLRDAMRAGGYDPDVIEERATRDDVIETDAQTVREQLHGMHSTVCAGGCGARVNTAERGVLREVAGWYLPRSAGGQNHVIQRRETGRVMCPVCSSRMQHTGLAAQETLL